MAKLFNIEPNDILGKQISISTFVPSTDPNKINETDVIEQEELFTIIGVVDDERSSLTYVPADALANITYTNYVGAKVKVSNSENMTNVREQIIGMGFLVSVLQDTIDQVTKIFSIVQIVLGLFGLIALTVSAIGMFNTMTVILLERTNEIGIMRSIGVTRKDVRKLFIFEAMIMGFLGGLGGVLLGYLGGFLANVGINLLANYFGGQALDLFSSPTWFVVLIILFSTIIGFMTGVFPAQRAAKINPLDALRYK
jgi:putative ABC transport system permease protein